MTNDQLAALILPWAKEKHPDKYEATLKVAVKPETFRRYLIRLVEIRWTEEPDWKNEGQIPISVLDESSLTLKARIKGEEEVMEFKGRLAAGPREYEFNEMVLSREEFLSLRRAKKTLDLEYIDNGTQR